MLILSRKVGEKIQIGEDITLMITDIRPNDVRIGIQAPPELVILRDDAKQRSAGEPDREQDR